MSYSPEQQKMINLGLRLSRGLPRKVRMSLIEAMAVESSFHNYDYGDADSEGVLQQRPSTGWGPASESAKRDIKQYLSHALDAYKGFHGTAGELAQTVQRSAFPDRYDQQRATARQLLGQGGGGGAPGGSTASFKPGGFDFQGAAATGLSHLAQGDYDPLEALGDLMAGYTPGKTTVSRTPGAGARGARGGNSGVVAQAKKLLGQPYLWGGESFKEGGFDCSGLVYWAYKKMGITLPRTAAEQLAAGKQIPYKKLRPGDLVGAKDGHHVVMYIGGGRVIAAPHTGAKVQIQPLSDFTGPSWMAVSLRH